MRASHVSDLLNVEGIRLAASHHVGVIVENRQPVLGNGPGKHVYLVTRKQIQNRNPPSNPRAPSSPESRFAYMASPSAARA